MSLQTALLVFSVVIALFGVAIVFLLIRYLGVQKSPHQSGGSARVKSTRSLTIIRSHLLERESETELLEGLAEHFKEQFNLEFSELSFELNSKPTAERDNARRFQLRDSSSGIFRWRATSGESLSADQLDQIEQSTVAYLSNLRRLHEYKRMAIRDPLTGLFNTAYLRIRLGEEIDRAKRSNISVGIMILDIDNFKEINDNHGHPVGDRILTQLSRLLEENVRSSDIVARYGGDELCIVLPDSDREQTIAFMNRLHQTAQEYAGKSHPTSPTLSIGAAVAPDQGGSAAELIKAADDALLSAKRKGKNCAVFSSGPTVSA